MQLFPQLSNKLSIAKLHRPFKRIYYSVSAWYRTCCQLSVPPAGSFSINICSMTGISLWAANAIKRLTGHNSAVFSTVYSPDGPAISDIIEKDDGIVCRLVSHTGIDCPTAEHHTGNPSVSKYSELKRLAAACVY